jgi:hypothetical protein
MNINAIFICTLTKLCSFKSFTVFFKKTIVILSNVNIFADIPAQKESFTTCLERDHSSIGTAGE